MSKQELNEIYENAREILERLHATIDYGDYSRLIDAIDILMDESRGIDE